MTNSTTESPSTPALFWIPFWALRLSKALESDKGKTIKTKKKSKGAGGGFEHDTFSLGLPASLSRETSFILLYNLFTTFSGLCCLCQCCSWGCRARRGPCKLQHASR